jgi:hypothetical protein
VPKAKYQQLEELNKLFADKLGSAPIAFTRDIWPQFVLGLLEDKNGLGRSKHEIVTHVTGLYKKWAVGCKPPDKDWRLASLEGLDDAACYAAGYLNEAALERPGASALGVKWAVDSIGFEHLDDARVRKELKIMRYRLAHLTAQAPTIRTMEF